MSWMEKKSLYPWDVKTMENILPPSPLASQFPKIGGAGDHKAI